jgi:hypothetical protein
MEDVPFPIEDIVTHLVGGATFTELQSRECSLKARIRKQMIDYGWCPIFLNYFLKRFDDTMMNGYNIYSFIEQLAKEYVKRRIDFRDESLTLFDIYTTIGLLPSKATEISKVCKKLWEDDAPYTKEQVVEIGIEYLIGKYTPMTSPTTKYLFSPDAINRWFDVTIREQTYSCINIPKRCKDTYNLKLSYPLHSHNSETNDLHFHTTSWQSSIRIMNDLNHALGRPCLDFGTNPGFYMSQNIKTALEWGQNNDKVYGQEVAILVFSLPKQFPRAKVTFKNLEGNLWKNVTKQSRLCTNRYLELSEISSYDLLFGNMVANPKQIIEKGAEPLTHNPPKTQLVSKHKKGDIFLQDHLIGCIYFRKS